MPLYAYFSCFYLQLVGKEEELDIEGETVDVHYAEEKLCCLFVEQLESALSVLCLDAKQDGDDGLEDK